MMFEYCAICGSRCEHGQACEDCETIETSEPEFYDLLGKLNNLAFEYKEMLDSFRGYGEGYEAKANEVEKILNEASVYTKKKNLP